MEAPKDRNFTTEDIPSMERAIVDIALMRAQTDPLSAGQRAKLLGKISCALWGVCVITPIGPDHE